MTTLSSILNQVSVGNEKRSERVSSSSGSLVWMNECAYERVVVYQDRAEVIRRVEVTVREGEKRDHSSGDCLKSQTRTPSGWKWRIHR